MMNSAETLAYLLKKDAILISIHPKKQQHDQKS